MDVKGDKFVFIKDFFKEYKPLQWQNPEKQKQKQKPKSAANANTANLATFIPVSRPSRAVNLFNFACLLILLNSKSKTSKWFRLYIIIDQINLIKYGLF